jgi:tRNA dimethylallyltransferase
MSRNQKIICVVGATASGKTGLGVELAKKFNGEIISADSRQVYRGLDLGTGKDLDEYGDVKYHLIDIVDPGKKFTVFDWLKLAKKSIKEIQSSGKTPIVVGGTGLYVKALVEGFEIQKSKAKSNNYNSKVKKFNRNELNAFDLMELQKIVKKLAANSYDLEAIDMNNPHRLIRFIEREQAGEKPTKKDPDFDYCLIGRDLPREKLYSKIDKRVEEWFEEGFYEEVESLLDKKVTIEWLNKIGLEYKILGNYILLQKLKAENNDSGIDELIKNSKLKVENLESFEAMNQAMKYAIHQYARRQLIWWRRFDVKWIKSAEQAVEFAKDFLCR